MAYEEQDFQRTQANLVILDKANWLGGEFVLR